MIKSDETKLVIANALEELLENNSIDHISVCDIMKRCNLTRQTFYRHFLDIYD